jgi:membrane protease YdiL (CAAX protease family)
VAFILGLLYVHLYRRTESLIPSVTLHIGGNTALVLMMLVTDLDRAEGLLIPLVGVSLSLLLIAWSLTRRLGPPDPATRLAWS